MTGDHQLRRDLIDELDFEPSVTADNIGVGVHDGIVTLTGFVSSYPEKVAAERAARRVRGVRGIAEEIEVRLPSGKKDTDDEIAKRAVDVLNWRFGVPANRIAVKVEKGTVTLTGDVEWQFQKRDAEEAIRSLAGVAGLSNLIRVRWGTQVAFGRDPGKPRECVASQCRTGRLAHHRARRRRQGDPRWQGACMASA